MYNERIEGCKGGMKMDDFLDTVEARGKEEGKAEGEAIGEARGKAEIIQEFIKAGKMTVEQIAGILKLPVENVRELAEMNLVTA